MCWHMCQAQSDTNSVQWVDFTDSSQFSDSCTKLLDAVKMTIGDGSGPERYT